MIPSPDAKDIEPTMKYQRCAQTTGKSTGFYRSRGTVPHDHYFTKVESMRYKQNKEGPSECERACFRLGHTFGSREYQTCRGSAKIRRGIRFRFRRGMF